MVETPGQMVANASATVVVLGLLFAAVGAPLLFGLAETINAYGDAMRWAFGG